MKAISEGSVEADRGVSREAGSAETEIETCARCLSNLKGARSLKKEGEKMKGATYDKILLAVYRKMQWNESMNDREKITLIGFLRIVIIDEKLVTTERVAKQKWQALIDYELFIPLNGTACTVNMSEIRDYLNIPQIKKTLPEKITQEEAL